MSRQHLRECWITRPLLSNCLSTWGFYFGRLISVRTVDSKISPPPPRDSDVKMFGAKWRFSGNVRDLITDITLPSMPR